MALFIICLLNKKSFSSVQLLSHVWIFATPWIAACQASLSITNSQSSHKFMCIESVMPSIHLILWHALLLLPAIPPSIRVFSNESALSMRWPKYWSFSLSISPSKEHPGLVSFRMDWLDLLAVQGTHKSLLQHLGVQNEAGQRLTELCQENTLVIANTLFQQHKRTLYTWTSPDGQHRNQIHYILCSKRWRSSIQSAKTRPGGWLWLRSWTLYCQIQT